MDRLIAIMARLRDPDRGCAWDLAQNFTSIASFTVEEAYEVSQAAADGDLLALKDELGDLLLQVVFHSRMAEEVGAFTIDDVIAAICSKMIRRHPHLFGPDQATVSDPSAGDTGGVGPNWEAIKADERRAAGAGGALDGVALALPALIRAEKIQHRAARVGFDWPDPAGARAKIDEELTEVDQADGDQRPDEIGDLLFSVVNWARHLGVDPEAALRRATATFECRFRAMEATSGAGFPALDLSSKEKLWQEVKRVAQSRSSNVDQP